MDPTAFATVKYEVYRLPCVDDKVQAIVYAQGSFYAEQVAELLNQVSYEDDKMKLLQSACPKMLPAACVGIIPVLRAFRSDSKRVQAVQLLSRQITDPLNFPMLNEVFPYANERDTVRGIMTRQATTVPPPPPPNVVHVGNPYPYGRPTPRMDPNDPVYRLVDKTVDVVAGGISSVLAPRRNRPGMVINTPAVVYQTTTVPSYPCVTISNPAPGIQVVETGAGMQPRPGVQYVYGAPPPPYTQQQYYQRK